MRFLVDAQLPPRLAQLLTQHGHNAVHVQSLRDGVRTSDRQIATHADAQQATVVTKDSDFRHSHTVTGSPRSLLLVATGNISNAALLALVDQRLDDIVAGFEAADFIELHPDVLILHSPR